MKEEKIDVSQIDSCKNYLINKLNLDDYKPNIAIIHDKKELENLRSRYKTLHNDIQNYIINADIIYENIQSIENENIKEEFRYNEEIEKQKFTYENKLLYLEKQKQLLEEQKLSINNENKQKVLSV